MAMTQSKMMLDSNGELVPVKYVSAFDKLRDRNVNRIVATARKLRTQLEGFVSDSIDQLTEISGQKEKLGAKGNFTASSFDGLRRVSIRQKYNIFLDERVIDAREKMFGYVKSVLARVNPDDAQALLVILEDAFRVGQNNMLSTGKVLSLLRMNIKNSDWLDAQQILKDALKPQKGKRYLQIETRPDTNHDYVSIRLDIADCWPVEVTGTTVPEVVK